MKELGKRAYTVFSALGMLGVLVPVMLGTFFTYLCEDDFGYEGAVKALLEEHGTVFKASLYGMKRMAMEQQATHLSNFILHFVRPYTRWGLTGYHICLFLLCVFFSLALFFLINSLCEGNGAAFGLLVLALLSTFQMAGTEADKEIFFWYTGAVNYTLMLGFSFLAIGLTIRSARSGDGKRTFIPASILACLASLGSLEIAAFNCGVLLMVALLGLVLGRADKRSVIMPLVFGVLGAVSDVVCPGNFARSGRQMEEGHSTLVDAFRDTFSFVSGDMVSVLKSFTFIAVLLLAFSIGVAFKVRVLDRKMSVIGLILIVVGAASVLYVTAFPVIFGQHSTTLENYRTMATYRIVERLMFILVALSLAQIIRENVAAVVQYIPAAAIVIAIVLCAINYKSTIEDIKDGFSYRIAADFYRGNIQRVYRVRKDILQQIEDTPDGEPVVVFVTENIDNRCMYGMGLMDQTDYMVNEAAARLFDVYSVAVIYE